MDDSQLFAPLSSESRASFDPEVDHPSISYWEDAWNRFKTKRPALIGLSILLFIIFMAGIGPLISGHTYYEINLDQKNLPPGATHWFGTDELGRDLFTRCWWGARISLFVGITASVIDLVIGVFFGSIAAYEGGKIDEWMMRFADALQAIPYLLVVILLMVVMGPGLSSIILALTFTGWINMARIVRSQILQTKKLDFILAARSFGASRWQILFGHLIPNAIGPIIVTLSMTIPVAIFAEAFLSFLGLGVQAPIASWGTMASDGLSALRFYPWRLFIPAALICLTMLSFNMLGDGLRDVLDPRLRK